MANVYLGNNLIRNCDAALVVNGVEVFRLRERTSDDKLLVDFDVRDEASRRIAKIANNNVVYVDPGFERINLAKESLVQEKATKKVIARAEELGAGTIRITGEFLIDDFRVLIIPEETTLWVKKWVKTATLVGNTIDGFGTAIVLGPDSMVIGHQ